MRRGARILPLCQARLPRTISTRIVPRVNQTADCTGGSAVIASEAKRASIPSNTGHRNVAKTSNSSKTPITS
ncbi:hypothetical protein CC2G_002231 [Coprinopsis cinerea AmutBmut pab1-1]|nr:hypothetical protein CC2G_002231 [Coprinopsis cinerea AmutBmut pab1-1]